MESRIRRLVLKAALAHAAALWMVRQSSAAMPQRLYLPVRPGGSVDLLGRSITAAMHSRMGAFAVFNIEGVSGELALRRLKQEPEDGNHWLLAQESVIAINPGLFPRSSPSPLDGLVPVSLVAKSHFYLLVRADSPARDFDDWLARARASVTPLPYGSGGVGTLHHLAMEELAQKLNFDVKHIPYKSPAQAAQGLLSQDIEALFAGSSSLPLVSSGKFRMLAVTQVRRMREFPDVPALAEYVRGFEVTNWFGLFARQGIPNERLRAMRDNLAALTRDSDLAAMFSEKAHITLEVTSGSAFEGLIARDHARYQTTIERLGIKV